MDNAQPLETTSGLARLQVLWRTLIRSQEFVLLLIGVLAIGFLASRSDKLLTADNLLQQGRFLAEVGLIALPMTFIIITGGIDLSVGSVFGMCAILMGHAWFVWGWPLELSIVFAMAVGMLGGLLNGLFIVWLRVPPLIMTLASLAIFRGIAQGVSEGRSVKNFPDWFAFVGNGNLLGVPVQVWILVVAALVCGVILARTVFGRTLYAIGSNEVAARFSGLPVNRVKLMIYALSGFMAALASYIFVARVTTTRSDMGTGFELDAIAAVVLGGTSIFGGKGSIAGTMIGVVLIQLLKNGLALNGVTGDATIVVIGGVLILAILINNFITGREAKA